MSRNPVKQAKRASSLLEALLEVPHLFTISLILPQYNPHNPYSFHFILHYPNITPILGKGCGVSTPALLPNSKSVGTLDNISTINNGNDNGLHVGYWLVASCPICTSPPSTASPACRDAHQPGQSIATLRLIKSIIPTLALKVLNPRAYK